jgi:hypothetical protein
MFGFNLPSGFRGEESRAPTTFKLEGEVTFLSESSQGEVGDNRKKWGDFWEKSIAINQNIVN